MDFYFVPRFEPRRDVESVGPVIGGQAERSSYENAVEQDGCRAIQARKHQPYPLAVAEARRLIEMPCAADMSRRFSQRLNFPGSTKADDVRQD